MGRLVFHNSYLSKNHFFIYLYPYILESHPPFISKRYIIDYIFWIYPFKEAVEIFFSPKSLSLQRVSGSFSYKGGCPNT